MIFGNYTVISILFPCPYVVFTINTMQSISTHAAHPDRLFAGLPVPTNYMWDNVIIEKRTSVNWLHKLYAGSILDEVWTVLSSPVH